MQATECGSDVVLVTSSSHEAATLTLLWLHSARPRVILEASATAHTVETEERRIIIIVSATLFSFRIRISRSKVKMRKCSLLLENACIRVSAGDGGILQHAQEQNDVQDYQGHLVAWA